MSPGHLTSNSRWTAYQVALRPSAPLHIGWRTFGNVRQTRPYIPGRTLWGALTARLARDLCANDYEAAARIVDREVRFGYFYPAIGGAIGPDPAAAPCWPWGPDGDEFAWRYLGSYTSTALRDGRSKLDGSLHEMEYIAPFTREGQPVWLAGPIWIRRASPPEPLGTPEELAILWKRLVIGAERGYGWGRFRHVRICLIEEGHYLPGTGWRWTAEAGEITVTNPHADSHLLAHLLLPDALLTDRDRSARQSQPEPSHGLLDWAIEPMLGRTTPLKGGHLRAGAQILQANLCVVPGSRVAPGRRYSVGPLGLWRTLSH